MAKLVAFTGGGSGGHVYPGLAVATELVRRHSVDLVWIGSTKGMEADIVRRAEIPYFGLPSGKLRRYFSLKNVVDLFKVGVGVLRGIFLLKRLRPALLFSKGGFVSVPPVIAARLLRIPVISHESDSDPGLATRINARFSTRILVAYEQTQQMFPSMPAGTVTVTGNPIRQELFGGDRGRGLQIAGFSAVDSRPVAFFIGGSQGASQINQLVTQILPDITETWRVVHQTGSQWESFLANGGVESGAARMPERGDYFSASFFFDELPHLLACSDVLVCRAGASSLWEGGALGKAMLLVPLIGGSRGDQVRNASIFEQSGAAEVFTNPASLAADVGSAMARLADPAARNEMGRRASTIAHRGAAIRIVTEIMRVLKE